MSTRIETTDLGAVCSDPGGSHNSAVGIGMYYDAATRNSIFGITTASASAQYLHSDGGLSASVESASVTTRFTNTTHPSGTNQRCKGSASVNFSGGNPFKVIGNWRLPA